MPRGVWVALMLAAALLQPSNAAQARQSAPSEGRVWMIGDRSLDRPGPGLRQVKGVDHIVALAAGGQRDLGLRADGTVWTWGNGDYLTQSSPDQVEQVAGLQNVVSIAADASGLEFDDPGHALRSDGTVWRLEQPPTQVPDLSDVVGITSANVALKRDGTVWSWQGGTAPRSDPFRLWRVRGLRDIVAIGARLALRSDGTVWAWGSSDPRHGQRPAPATVFDPEMPTRVPGIEDSVAIDSGWLSIHADGRVQAWGGQLRNTGTLEPFDLVGVSNMGAVAGDLRHVLLAEGTVPIGTTPQPDPKWPTIATTGDVVSGPEGDSWTITYAPPRLAASAVVWTGSEMFVWGAGLDTGWRYDPRRRTWRPVPPAPGLLMRSVRSESSLSAVWTGREVILWLGDENAGGTGARFDPMTDQWAVMAPANELGRRLGQVAVWTGQEMLLWGGATRAGFVDGARYDPQTNSWSAMASLNVIGKRGESAVVWTGTELLVWGGRTDSATVLNDGAVYNPATDSWRPISTANAPSARAGPLAVWTGKEMIVWEGRPSIGDGGRYDPQTDTWTPMPYSAPNAPFSFRGVDVQSAVWTGREMLVWGDSPGRYDPVLDQWAPMPQGPPQVRARAAAVWTGNELVVWGGYIHSTDMFNGSYSRIEPLPIEGGHFYPASGNWELIGSGQPPPGVRGNPSVWTGDELLTSTARYDPLANSWTKLPAAALPSSKDATMVWTGMEALLWGGDEAPRTPTGEGSAGRFNPITNSWTPITTRGAPIERAFHTSVWTGTEMIVFGGISHNDPAPLPARYDPRTDTWTLMNGAPTPRFGHTAVWTGSEMLIWGGQDTVPLNAGQMSPAGVAYNPATDSWRAMSTIGAPSPRTGHVAVWTGREMLVWGGTVGRQPVASGGAYDPLTDTWRPLPATDHVVDLRAVWTGREMVVWGGPERAGARYDPTADRWVELPPIGSPGQQYFSSVWTGTQMLVLGDSPMSFAALYTPPP